MKEIQIKCQGAGTLPLENLTQFQGNLKTITPANLKKLRSRILDTGFVAPIFIWKNGKINYILDGHQRILALLSLQGKGYHIPDLPVAYIEADNEEDARKKLLSITSTYGDFNLEELQGWLTKVDEDIADSMRFFDKELNTQLANQENNNPEKNPYTNKIKAPIYEPKGENPPIKELVNTEKTDSLIREIKAADIKNKKLEDFLIQSAYRHTVFTYDKIAEFYSHATPEIKLLMENSALVIIDFNKAIENGFVRLTEDFAEAYTAEDF